MPGMPAARVTDMHTCPICMGAPMPIMPPGAPTVLIGGLPAARLSDLCTCANPAGVDAIIFGSPTVIIMGMPAARLADPTALGGVILPPCCPTVLIGLAGASPPGAPGMNIWEETLPDGTVVTHVGPNITIVGSKDYRDAVLRDLQKLQGTPTGADLLAKLNEPGRGPVKIVETTGKNETDGVGPGGDLRPDGSHGPGSGSTVHYNPNNNQIFDGSQDWMTRPPAVGLGHELIHSEQAQDGTWSGNKTNGVENDELAAVGLPPYQDNAHTENKIRKELGQPQRTF